MSFKNIVSISLKGIKTKLNYTVPFSDSSRIFRFLSKDRLLSKKPFFLFTTDAGLEVVIRLKYIEEVKFDIQQKIKEPNPKNIKVVLCGKNPKFITVAHPHEIFSELLHLDELCADDLNVVDIISWVDADGKDFFFEAQHLLFMEVPATISKQGEEKLKLSFNSDIDYLTNTALSIN